MANNLMVFTGNANPVLADNIAKHIGVPLGYASISKFSDGEISVELNENVRGKDVFIIQPTCAPTNDSIMELLLMADALHRASANRITAVIPYFGYARQDRRVRSARVAISAKVVADMISAVGVNRVLTVDLHAEQIQGFFSIPVDNVYGSPLLTDDIERQRYDNPLVVSPDIGGVVRARAVAKQLNVELAIIDKRRPIANEAQVMHIIGDVAGRSCILVDDMVDTAGTLCKAADALKEARRCRPVFAGRSRAATRSAFSSMPMASTIPAFSRYCAPRSRPARAMSRSARATSSRAATTRRAFAGSGCCCFRSWCGSRCASASRTPRRASGPTAAR